jgi:large subunit ribosomal protein L4
MPKVNILDMAGKTVGEMELSESVFGAAANKSLLHEAVKVHLANRRQGTQSTLTRAEVRGGGKKPWRQKGTGRARQGSIRNPQWTGGGIALGPKPRDHGLGMNKKARKAAMRSALSAKASAGALYVIDNLELPEIKTKQVVAFLNAVAVDKKTLLVTPEPRINVIKSARNLPGVRTAVTGALNVYEILNADALILDSKAVAKIEEVWA